MNTQVAAALAAAALTIPLAPNAAAQARDTACAATSASLAGIVHDSTGAAVASATVTLENGTTAQSSANGHFEFRCVPVGAHHLHITAESFADADVDLTRPKQDVALTLIPQQVEQAIDVTGDAPAHGVDNTENTGASRTIQGDTLKELAEDPDDLKRQLQQLTAGNGGNPSSAIITVDGFQTEAQLPPKAAIAYIRINPDPFSAEYQEPPYEGGRVEVYTKPGASRYHGALFMAYGGSALNARDPFSTSKGTIGKQRYGAELSGPVRKLGSDFALALQHRTIDTVAVVNAVSLDSAGNQVTVNQTVPTPQSQWSASARLAWQLGAKNTFISNYTATTNNLSNLGVGGNSLAEQGYGSADYEHVIRVTNITTVSPHIMHEGRISFAWSGTNFTPVSLAPQVQVSGAFSGGGAPLGAQRDHELLTNIFDDAIVTLGNHTVKFGTDMRIARMRMQNQQNTNGTYTFGGGNAPMLDASGNATGASETITALEQYRRAQRNLPGGTPTAYTVVTGSSTINFTQVRANFFVQEDWKLRPNLKLSGGLRYQAQNRPSVPFTLIPRAGITWSPDKKQEWTFRLHAGMFGERYSTRDAIEFERLGNPVRQSLLTYAPTSYTNPLGTGGNVIRTVRTFAPNYTAAFFSEVAFGAEHAGKKLTEGVDYYILRLWNVPWVRNINTPLNGNPYGPRPFAPNLNILQSQNAGMGSGRAIFAHVGLQNYKPASFFLGYVYVAINDYGDDDTFDQPQSNTSNAGEMAPRANQSRHNVFMNGTLHLPLKLDLSTEANGRSNRAFNITTGFDNNGDGNFNDRPQFAIGNDPNAVTTPFGRLVATGGTGTLRRNSGQLPWVAYVDMNLARSFILTPHAQKDRLQTLSVNVRSANILNHTNVTKAGGVLGSPQFLRPYAADTGRRIEFGIRYGF